MVNYPATPDGRYFVVKGRLWRCTNPNLNKETRQQHVNQLMNARRQVKEAKKLKDQAALEAARSRVHQAKVALGERGPVWWDDGTPDFNQYLAKNTPYADWYATLTEGSSPDAS